MAQGIVKDELDRRSSDVIVGQEVKGYSEIGKFGFTLGARADRIDRAPNGGLIIYDYKTGTPPSKKQVYAIEKQLPLEALIALRGGFPDIPAKHIEALRYIVLKGEGSFTEVPLKDGEIHLLDKCWEELEELIATYQSKETGYTARDRPFSISYASDYDHLSRFGEWSDSDEPNPKAVP
jgi:RecB family exonuclease